MTAATEPSLLLLYGSLRRGEPMFDQLGLAEALEFVSPAVFAGELYDLGDYPGALPGDGLVSGELFRIRDPGILDSLDRYEEFDSRKPEDSLFLRRSVSIPGLGEAWVYFYNGSPDGQRRIASGDWRKRRSAA